MQDLKKLSKLSKLEFLDLSYNDFENDILRLLEFLPSLKSLYLHENKLEGSLSNQDLKNISRLETLDLSKNQLVGNIPSTLGELAWLKGLSLAMNNFNGSMQGLCELKRLEELDLSINSFEGMIPPCLNNMKSLRYIDLSNNKFEGSFAINSLASHSKLEIIALTCDSYKLKLDAENLDHINPLFQLKVLKLSNCNLNKIPQFLLHQHKLRVLDLSQNQLKGMFPAWLLENKTELEVLNLRNNSFAGELYVPIKSMRNLLWIDVSRNDFKGQLQNDFGRILSNSQYVNFSYNNFEGDLPSSVCSTISNLEVLDLSFNNFSGEVPKNLVSCSTNLEYLVLSQNKFRGEIFSTHFNLTGLTDLQLSGNQFTGSLPSAYDILSILNIFDISNNRISGKIPSWFANVYHIGLLDLRNNSFEGEFPCKETLSVEYLDISHNSLSGPLPHCFDNTYLKQLSLEGNNFSGSIPSALLNFSALKVLNLRDNRLFGSIPVSIGNLRHLRALLLGNNHFSGVIPKEVCELDYISIMDLSNNFFSGSTPRCFYNITFGYNKILGDYTTLAEDVLDVSSGSHLRKFNGRFLHFDVFPDFIRGQFEIDFVTKNRHNSYKGDILNFMSGLDLSSNNLTGQIPPELGYLSVHGLNLSHNRFVGSIPISFSNLSQIESLDLSYNGLSGQIPSEIISLGFLEVFNVTHNYLSGKIPDTRQFSTFDESSYRENPLLCGILPLNRNCTETPQYSSPILLSDEADGKWFEVDLTVFYATFVVTYLVILLSFVLVLFINPLWRRRWFRFIERCMYSSYYFVIDIVRKLSAKF